MREPKNKATTKGKELSKNILEIYNLIKNEMLNKSGRYKLTIAKEKELAKKTNTTHKTFKKAFLYLIDNNYFFKEDYKNNKTLCNEEKKALEEKRKKNRERQRRYYRRKAKPKEAKEYEEYNTSIYIIFDLCAYFIKVSTPEDKEALKKTIIELEKELKREEAPSKKISIKDFLKKVEETKQKNLEKIKEKQLKEQIKNNSLDYGRNLTSIYNEEEKINFLPYIIFIILVALLVLILF